MQTKEEMLAELDKMVFASMRSFFSWWGIVSGVVMGVLSVYAVIDLSLFPDATQGPWWKYAAYGGVSWGIVLVLAWQKVRRARRNKSGA